jgi:hypothetical protein
MAYRLNLRRDAIRWLRAHRAQLYVDMLMQARAEQFYLSVITGSDNARMREVFAETDTRLPPRERARLGANGTVFASPEVLGLYELLFAEAWPVEVNPGQFRSDEARIRVLGRTAGILGDLEAAICRELGAGQIPLVGSVRCQWLAPLPVPVGVVATAGRVRTGKSATSVTSATRCQRRRSAPACSVAAGAGGSVTSATWTRPVQSHPVPAARA